MSPRSCSCHPDSTQAVALAPAAALLLALVLLALPTGARADLHIHGQVSGVPALTPGVGFALHLAREDLALAYEPDDDTEKLSLRRVGVTFSEAVGARTRMGLRLGRLWSSQSGRAATADLDPEGYYLDLAVGTVHHIGGGLQATLDASWRYAVTDASEAEVETDLEWQALTLRPALRWTPRERMAVRTGATLIALDGDERTRGPQGTTTAGFESDGHVGGFIALELLPQPDDVVTFQLEGGPRTGVFASFEHRY